MKCIKTVLENGMRVLVVPMPSNPTVTVLVLVEAGSKYETKENNGISHFLEHMCFKGTTNRPSASDLSIELDGLGCESNAFTGTEYTGYYAKGKASDAEHLLDIIADLYLNPLFPSEEIEKEKGVIVGEIDMNDDNPMQAVRGVWSSLLYGDQPAGRTVLGTREIVRSLTREDFVKYCGEHYVAEATTVIVSGSVDPAQSLKSVIDKFSGISCRKMGAKKATHVKQSRPHVATLYRETNQTHLRLGVRSFSASDKRNPIVSVLEAVLGSGMSSRLFRKMRDELGLGYYVSAGSSTFTDHGHFVVATGVTNERLEEAVRTILVEMQDLKQNLVGAAELIKVKNHLIGTMYLGLETSDSFALHYGGPEILHCDLNTPQEEELLISAVTAEEVRGMARELFVEKHLNLALVGPFKDNAALESLLRF